MQKSHCIFWLLAIVAALVLITVAVSLYGSVRQLRAIQHLESNGVKIYLASEVEVRTGKEVRTWNVLEEWLLPRKAYVRVVRLDFRQARTLPANERNLLDRFETLKDVNLAGTNAGNADVAALARMPSVVHLVLRDTQVTDQCIGDLARMHLYSLDIWNTRITSAAQAELCRQQPQCEIRDLSDSWPPN